MSTADPATPNPPSVNGSKPLDTQTPQTVPAAVADVIKEADSEKVQELVRSAEYKKHLDHECKSGYTPSEGPHEAEGSNELDAAPVTYPEFVPGEPSYFVETLDSVPGGAHISDHDLHLLHKAHHQDPFGVLGCHPYDHGDGAKYFLVRAWIKDARDARLRCVPGSAYQLVNDNEPVWLHRKGEWMFQMVFKVVRAAEGKPLPTKDSHDLPPFLYELIVRYEGDGSNTEFVKRDAYSFGCLLPDFDLNLFRSGSCWHVDCLLGGHVVEVDAAKGVRFAVWAPNAVFVSVVGDWNQWDGRAHPMRKRHDYGVWELFIADVAPGMKYGYRIHGQNGMDFVKIDPYAQEFENPPAYASIVSGCDDAYKKPADRFKWTDQEWMRARREDGKMDVIRRRPMSIYEVHLPSWMRGDNNSYLGYREVAHRLVNHVKACNFTHIEFMPLAQHPFEGSWGYQTVGLYAPYSRLGNPDDLKYLINELHKEGIGVFLDFVPGHFVKDDWGLVYYDGVPLYEYADPKEGEHLEWGTMVFNFRRSEVRSFLLGAAYHWLRRYHIDGLRIDAVSSMLYKNHMRGPGQWIANEHGGDANLQAISLLQEMNWVVHKEFPGVFTMAEESTSWQGVTNQDTGLGFDAKWDLGWMNDTLEYLTTPGPMRGGAHSKLTFRGLYVAHEKWVLPLSHDEVVSGKGSLLDKCGFQGTPFEERLKTLRTLYGFQVGVPGRPLIFMGGEIAQGREWKESRSVDWHEGEEDSRKKTCDDESWNFQWVDCDNASDNLIAFLRKYGEWYNDILVICNFSGNTYYRYPIGCPHGGEWEVLLNSDDWRYGGAMNGPGNLSRIHTTQGGRIGWPYCLWLDIPAFGCLYLKAPTPPEVREKQEQQQKEKKAAEGEGDKGGSSAAVTNGESGSSE
ncbi:unnamed protein product [Vitrella brassicaformis CCMP3155]|uniref:1,4-alpha-glucan branching enzyme n=1 Tax=Vitrella brassicaformis (strain CCMP3155) TaxID=1169540 RepID=A0A0G4F702_VITBC|nr:unnamed protein product [Vitrella brassicaformis CCMP3155]|eukprot:CEM07799.1 unnamed protein product [Vitrella brassicaformis CCMP3155]